LKKSIWIFLLAVLLPSLVLGWLALRSAEEQQIILERRTAELYQKETESAAAAVRAGIDEQRRAFNDAVNALLARSDARKLGGEFAALLPGAWPRKAVGFAIDRDGRMLSPTLPAARTNPTWEGFLTSNGAFLSSNVPATVYAVSGDELNRSDAQRKMKIAPEQQVPLAAAKRMPAEKTDLPAFANEAKKEQPENPAKSAPSPAAASAPTPVPPATPAIAAGAGLGVESRRRQEAADAAAAPAPPGEAIAGKDLAEVLRNVAPQRQPDAANVAAVSQLVPATADFRALTAGGTDGVIARFVQDQLEILFWLRPAVAPEMIFGCLIEADSLRNLWPAMLPAPYESSGAAEFILALLDDKARPVATQPPGESGRDWKRRLGDWRSITALGGGALPAATRTIARFRPHLAAQSDPPDCRRACCDRLWRLGRHGRCAPATRACGEEDRLRLERLARTQDPAYLDPDVCGADARRASGDDGKGAAISAHHHGRSRAAHSADQQRS
jgi:hypothetical protein